MRLPRFIASLRGLSGDRPADLLVALVAALSVGPAVWGRRVELDGLSYWLLGDDAMISLHYARSLATGAGLVFNPGERVEGFTNPLWTLWMTVGFAPGVGRPWSGFPALVACAFALVLLAVATRRLARAVGASPGLALAAGLAAALSRDITNWAVQGFETVPLALAVTLAALRIVREAPTRRWSPGTVALLGAVPLLRGDGVVLLALLGGLALAAGAGVRATARALLVPVGLVVLATAARLAYYGDVVPNTARLKVFGGALRLSLGWRYLLRGAGATPGLAAASLLALVVGPPPVRWLARVVVPWALWVLWIGGDAFPGRRFLLPVLPLALAVAAALPAGWRALPGVRVGIALLAIVLVPLRLPGVNGPLVPPLDPRDRGNLVIGLLLRAHTPPGAVVADQWAGTTLYFAERRGVDLLGKVDGRVARHAPVHPGPAPGHNRWDLAWSLGTLRPDYVIAPTAWPPSPQQRRELERPALRFAHALVTDPRFLSACAPHPMPWPTWRAVLRCAWP